MHSPSWQNLLFVFLIRRCRVNEPREPLVCLDFEVSQIPQLFFHLQIHRVNMGVPLLNILTIFLTVCLTADAVQTELLFFNVTVELPPQAAAIGR